MYRDKKRYGQDPRRIARSKTTFYDPLGWKEPRLVFTCSWSDWFIEDADPWRAEAWEVIRASPQHSFQILTKRPERISLNLPATWGDGWANVWLGVSVERQDYLHRVTELIGVPARTRFISAEPLLGPLRLGDMAGIHWVITGGESGPGARPMDVEWVKAIRDQCDVAGVAFFHKQNGGGKKVDGAWGGRMVDGRIYDSIPAMTPA
jgi:protein gp37